MTNVDPLDTLFHHLDTWRHLPNYQLERRADVLFSIYLRGVIQEFTDVELAETIIPEFPLKRDLIWPELKTNKSVKVDYALFARDGKKVFFVELKTDDSSRRTEQDIYLKTAKRLGFKEIVNGVRSIILTTTAHQKYHHLSTTLARLGYLSLPPDLASHIHPKPSDRLMSKLAEIVVTDTNPDVEVIYIQPTTPPRRDGYEPDRCIDFEMFAKHVEKFDDRLSRNFAEHLRLWKAVAGSRLPKPTPDA